MARTSGKITAEKYKACQKWVEENVHDDRIRPIAHAYWQHSIVLYSGAGVSTAKNMKGTRYGLPTWLNLLKEVAQAPEFEIWPENPWLCADKAVELCGGRERFKIKLENTIGSAHNYTKSNGQLNGTFVRNAPTLNAVAAFCGQLTGRLDNSETKETKLVHFRTSANPKVHAVITANYDCFLESAASNLYRKSPLKPVTALGSLAGSASRIPVFHIHGYVPHPFWRNENREQAVPTLIITREDYEKHWNTKDVFGTTMGPQIHYLRYYTVLFVGFSFNDEYVCKLLRQINQDYLSHSKRTHFALLQDQVFQKLGKSFFQDIGVMPIVYQEHDEIPAILGEIYKAGLATDRIIANEISVEQVALPELTKRRHKPTGENHYYLLGDIWKIMMSCRNESMSVGIVHELECEGRKV